MSDEVRTTADRDISKIERLTRIAIAQERIATALEAIVILVSGGTTEQPLGSTHTPEGDPDYLAALAAEVEGRIQEGATPRVGRNVEVQETIDGEVEEGMWINLFEQPRRPLNELTLIAPKDILIEEANREPNPLFVAALEVVYSNLPPDQWGSERAKQHIAELIKLHKEE